MAKKGDRLPGPSSDPCPYCSSECREVDHWKDQVDYWWHVAEEWRRRAESKERDEQSNEEVESRNDPVVIVSDREQLRAWSRGLVAWEPDGPQLIALKQAVQALVQSGLDYDRSSLVNDLAESLSVSFNLEEHFPEAAERVMAMIEGRGKTDKPS